MPPKAAAPVSDEQPAQAQTQTQKQKQKDKDPVIQEYDVYLTTDLEQQIYLLQYPNRERDHTFKAHVYPSAMRIKPQAGYMEMDLPIHFTNFDKARGVRWGEALRQVKEEGNTGGLGIAGGFGGPAGRVAGVKAKKPPKLETHPAADGADMDMDDDEEVPAEDKEINKLLENFEQSAEEGRVLNKQTLGGQILKDVQGQPMYMLGAFKGKELHLTRLAGLVQMRPQFHHIDALKRVEATARRRAEAASLPPPSTEPRAVFESLKPASEQDESSNTNTLATTLNKSREERWVDLEYHHEETGEAYDEYYQTLLPDDATGQEQLISDMDNSQYLDAISAERVDPSGRSKKKPMTRHEQQMVDAEEDDPDQPSVEVQASTGTRAATTTASRKGKAKA